MNVLVNLGALFFVLIVCFSLVAPAHSDKGINSTTGFRKERLYLIGWNLYWAQACNISGTWDAILSIDKNAKRVLSGKDLELWNAAEADMSGFEPGGCSDKKITRIINWTNRFLDTKK